ncbi:MAG: hypothetical protein M1821_003430 [Bathelium mastoideum]|nr:MAG: hypothetical protein M1821_003430 [Bathelium mastoideum]KAI9686012.1 MAG: hypothetical protein M1822_003995 [Bathelium mastoideum]
MQFKNIAVLAFAASAVASPELDERQATSAGVNTASIYQVLQTALPPSIISLALTNSAAASSAIASEFAGGQTPSWFSALPSDVQTYLVPVATTAAASITSAESSIIASASSFISSANSSLSAVASNLTASAANSTATSAAGNSSSSLTTTSSSGASSTLGGSTGSLGSGGASSTGAGSSTSSAGAALPTAIIGGGLAGALGLLGVLAL